MRSRSGEVSLGVAAWLLTAKSLRPMPDKRRGISDPETRVRQRYLDLTVNAAARERLGTDDTHHASLTTRFMTARTHLEGGSL